MSRPPLSSSFRALLAALVAGLSAVRADTPALLRDAIDHRPNEHGRWAYTFTNFGDHFGGKTIDASKPEPGKETSFRFDPSKPFAEEYTALRVDGRAPNADDVAKYRDMGVKRGQRMLKEDASKKPDAPKPAARKLPDEIPIDVQFLGDRKATADLTAARIVEETPTSVTYDIPLRPGTPKSLPVDRMQIRIQVNKARRRIEGVSMKLTRPFRLLGIINLKQVDDELTAEQVDPQSPEVFFTHFHVAVTATILIKTFHWSTDMTWTDWKQVKPFHPVPTVHLGPMNVLDF